MMPSSSWGPADSVPSSTFTPQDPTVEQVRLAIDHDVTFVLASTADRAFLVQKLLSEESVDLCLSNSLAILLIPQGSCQNEEEELKLARERVSLWSNYVQRIIDQKVFTPFEQGDDAIETTINRGGVVVCTPKDLSDNLDRVVVLPVSLVIVDNAQVCLGGRGSFPPFGDLFDRLREKSAVGPSRSRLVAVTSSLQHLPSGFDNFPGVSRALVRAFPGRVETSCELLSLLRHSAGAKRLRLVRHRPAQGQEEEDATEQIDTLVDRCRRFFDAHEYSLFETYGEEFRDLIDGIPDPAEVPRILLDRFVDVLRRFGLYSADRAALLLVIQLERLKTREKYERHFLLLGMLYTTLVLVRKVCEEEFDRSGLLPQDQEALMRRHSTPKLFKLVDILLQFKPEHVGTFKFGKYKRKRPIRSAMRDKSEKPAENVEKEEVKEEIKCPKEEEEEEEERDATMEKTEKCTQETEEVQDERKEEETAKDVVARAEEEEEEQEQDEEVRQQKQTSGGHPKEPPPPPSAPRPFRRGYHRRHPYSSYEDPDSLYGVVFVRSRFHAKVLYHFLKDLSRADDRFSFLSPQYVMGPPEDGGADDTGEGDEDGARRKQEEALRRFRMKESNLLVTNSLLEVGIETARCNLVVAFDAPGDFRTFAYQKVKARSKYASILFMEEEGGGATGEGGSQLAQKLAEFCATERRLLTRCSYRDPPAEEALEADKLGNSWLPSVKEEENHTSSAGSSERPASGSSNEANAADSTTKEEVPPSSSPSPSPSPAPPAVPAPSAPSIERRPHRRGRGGGHLHPSPAVSLRSAVYLLNRYCARLPSDTFTRLTPLCVVRSVAASAGRSAFVCALQLPVNSCLRQVVFGPPAPSETLAKRAAAMEVLRRLRALKEVDEGMAPIGKEGFLSSAYSRPSTVSPAPAPAPAPATSLSTVANDVGSDKPQAEGPPKAAAVAPGTTADVPSSRDFRTGTTKRRQYYYKQVARSLVRHAEGDASYHLYAVNLCLTCPIPEDQNTRGRRIYPPENAAQSFGFLVSERIPQVCPFPIYTRSGEVLVTFVHLAKDVKLDSERRTRMLDFHRYTFAQVLRMEKYPMAFSPERSDNSVMIVPLKKNSLEKEGDESGQESPLKSIDWEFLEVISKERGTKLETLSDESRSGFEFVRSRFSDAVVMPWYRNRDQPQYFYVAEICDHLNPKSDFPAQGFSSFEKYYKAKYGLQVQNLEQPLLDVDHTSARLNFLTPRYVNRKGISLPSSSEETKKNKRENLEQKQILVPELCSIHPFPGTLWRQAVSLPCIFYRLNGLLLADQLRAEIAAEMRIGTPSVADGFRWPPLDFGWTLADVLRNRESQQQQQQQQKGKGRSMARGDGSKLAGLLGEGDADSDKDSRTELEALSDRLVDKIKEEDRKLKKKSLEIGMWSNEMASKLDEEGRFDEDMDEEELDEMFGPNVALPDNLTILNNVGGVGTGKTNKKSQGRDWGTGIEQKRFRVASPTFFSNPNINIPGLIEDEDDFDDDFDDDLSYVDSEDEEWENKKKKKKNDDLEVEPEVGGSSGVARIEFRGNQAEAIEDEAVATKRAEWLLKSKEDEEKMLKSLPWPDPKDFLLESEEKEETSLSPVPCVKEEETSMEELSKFLFPSFVPSSSGPRPTPDPATASEAFLAVEEAELSKVKGEMEESLGFSARQVLPTTSSSVQVGVIRRPGEVDGEPKFSFDEEPDLSLHPGPSPAVLLQALTMSNSNDAINLERLETVGDSFLKHAITSYLFSVYENVHEGRLSHLRSKQVSNVHLYHLGKQRRLGERMIASKFEPHDNWLPPCYHVPKDLETALIESGVPSTHWNMAELTGLLDGDGGEGRDKEELCRLIRSRAGQPQEKRQDQDLPSFVPYNLLTQHSIPDKSVADCAEALIGAYLVATGQRGALLFMSWIGLEVLPKDPETGEYGRLLPPTSPLLRVVDNPEGHLEYLLHGYDKFEERIGYRFKDRSYLLQAFTHASYYPNRLTDCYQRLEFLGDAVLDYLITRHLYEDDRKHSPGALTDLRSALVNNTIFASLAVRHEFHKYFRHFSPGLQAVINRFVRTQMENGHAISDDALLFLLGEEEAEAAEDVEVPKALGDIFESVAGAVYLDSGRSLDTVWRVYYGMMRGEIERFSGSVPKSPIRELLELEPETARFGKPEKLADGRRVRVTVEVFGRGTFKGIGRNYRIAKCTAAKCALRALRRAREVSKED